MLRGLLSSWQKVFQPFPDLLRVLKNLIVSYTYEAEAEFEMGPSLACKVQFNGTGTRRTLLKHLFKPLVRLVRCRAGVEHNLS